MKILIIGGHGKVALLAAPMLTRGGHAVASVVRNADHVSDVEATGAMAIVSDIEHMDETDTRALVRGYDAIVWAAGAGGGSKERTYAVDRDAAIRAIDAAVAEGVDRFVMVSYVGAGRDNVPADNPFHAYADAKAAADDHLRRTALNWTILGPGQLTLDEPTSRIEYGDHVTEGETSRGNVAELVTGAVGRSDLGGVTINFRDGNVAIWEAMESLARRADGTPVATLREGQPK
ncbi:MAG: SDR family oxidoreductase [Propionibacteriaceae bacterium]|nr:SDR family oxidoreductase [Propionibacteriaceae bacterium]